VSNKKALGRGIGALFQETTEPAAVHSDSVTSVLITQLRPNPYQPRTEFDGDTLNELSASIKSKGILQPLLVEPEQDGLHTIIAGERRYRAAKMAGVKEVPVVVRDFSEREKLEIALIENIQREDLNPIEEARAYQSLMESHSLSQEELAEHLGKNRTTLANAVRLLRLSEEMQQALVDGVITSGHARALLAVKAPDQRKMLFARIITEQLSVRETERMAANLNSEDDKKKKTQKPTQNNEELDPSLKEFQQKLIDNLGTKVQMQGDMEKGKIEIHYFSREDLDRLYEVLIGYAE